MRSSMYKCPSLGGTPEMYNREKAVAFAKAQIGKPYQWAGNGDPGFDCSGLVRAAVIAGGGPVLPHQSGAQVADDAVVAVSPTGGEKKKRLPGGNVVLVRVPPGPA